MNKEITMVFTDWERVILYFLKEDTKSHSSGGDISET
jgi:hypothetical protein